MTSLWCLYCWLWKYSTPFLSISFLNFGKCCRLGLPAEINVQTSKNYEECKDRCKLCHINQTSQITTWNVTCIEFIKQTECRLWSNIYEIYWDFCSARITSLQEKTVVETISVTTTHSSDVRCLDLYLMNIFTKYAKTKGCTDITFKLTLYCLSVTVENLNL